MSEFITGIQQSGIGVINAEEVKRLYKEILGMNILIFEDKAVAKLLGSVQIELIQTQERKPERIFSSRYWRDCGFIHLCFDVLNMSGLKQHCTQTGYPFSIDSDISYQIGASAGRFCYVEDPDGTLIELVETHKVSILMKLGWYLDLKKRKGDKRLPDWVIGMLALNKIR